LSVRSHFAERFLNGRVKRLSEWIHHEKEAKKSHLVRWLLNLVAGAGFEPTTFGL
jgi:hypothetical protein